MDRYQYTMVGYQAVQHPDREWTCGKGRMLGQMKKADWWISMSAPGLRSMGQGGIQEDDGAHLDRTSGVHHCLHEHGGVYKRVLGELENRFGAFLEKTFL